MSKHGTHQRPLICPNCFSKEIDPVILEVDPETSEYYCPRCIYVAKNAKQVCDYYDEVIFRRYGIKRKE